MISVAYIWIIIAIICFLIELITPTFSFFSISFGAFFGWVTSLITDNIFIQLSIFILAFLIFFIKLRPILYKNNNTNFNKDSLIGNIAKANSLISDSKGTIKMNGSLWQARCSRDTSIEKGENVIILKIEGNKLIVAKEDKWI